jgi:hypothetical protein
MTKEELVLAEFAIEFKCNQQLHKLRTKYVAQRSRFKVGDFITEMNVIIKVDDVTFEIEDEELIIVYYGAQYEETYDDDKAILIKIDTNQISIDESITVNKY